MAFRSVSSAVDLSGTSLSPALPPGFQAGDILGWVASNDSSSATLTPPSGFVEISGSPITCTAEGQRLFVATKVATGSESGVQTGTVSSAGGGGKAFMFAYSGRDTTTPLDVTPSAASNHATSASPITVTASTITTVTDGCDVLMIAALDATGDPDNAAWTPPAGFTERVDSDGTWSDIMLADKTQSTAGATGAAAATATTSFTAGWMAFQIALRPAAGGGSSTTVTPAQATITVSGNAPSMNPFTNIRIREVLISESGSPVGSQTGIHLIVWYGGAPSGAPDLSYSDMTTDANGTTSWSLATGSLIYNQGVFYVAHDGHSSMSFYTCARMIPTYS